MDQEARDYCRWLFDLGKAVDGLDTQTKEQLTNAEVQTSSFYLKKRFLFLVCNIQHIFIKVPKNEFSNTCFKNKV